jgi:hypothetical protein
MRHFFTALCLCLLPFLARAQDNLPDSVFADYGQYAAYVDKMVTTRQFVPFIKKMGGADEYTEEELAKIEAQFLRLFPADFTARTVFRQEDLGGGMRQEGRMFWNAGTGYAFYYAVLHERADALVVLNFALNTKIEPIMSRF